MKAFLSCACPFVLIFCKQPMINLHWLQMFTENCFHCFLGRVWECTRHALVLQTPVLQCHSVRPAVHQRCVSRPSAIT